MSEQALEMCKNCMAPLTPPIPCSCGGQYVENKKYHLEADTLLRGNFFIGKTLSYDGESTVYIGYDREKQEKIFIHEYFPYPISVRHENRETVLPVPGGEVSYKALLSEYEELIKLQMKLSNEYNIISPYTIMGDNNTVYGMYNYNNYTELEEYLNQKKQPLIWADMKGAFLQLCGAVLAMHKQGYIHRGISSKTLLVDEKGHIYLTGFSTAANRTLESEVRATLFNGYAAPEQYSPTKWQGEWTDVYGLSAILYRCLTGSSPISPEGGKLKSAIELNPDIPEYVSKAIEFGLKSKTEERLSDVSKLTAMLLEDISANTTVFNAQEADEKFDMYTSGIKDFKHTIHGGTLIIENVEKALLEEQNSQKKKKNFKLIASVVSVFALFLAVTIFSIPEEVALPVEEEPEFVIQPFTTLYMPDFSNLTVEEILREEAQQDGFKFVIEEQYSDEIEDGHVIAQIPSPNTPYVNKPYVILTVSMGMRSVPMPHIIGMEVTDAMITLENYGIQYDVFEVIDDELTHGIVGRTSISSGEAVDIYEDTVYLYTGSSEHDGEEEGEE